MKKFTYECNLNLYRNFEIGGMGMGDHIIEDMAYEDLHESFRSTYNQYMSKLLNDKPQYMLEIDYIDVERQGTSIGYSDGPWTHIGYSAVVDLTLHFKSKRDLDIFKLKNIDLAKVLVLESS